ncbi:hypothetical protein NQZ68_021106 [Dissostichus eleginoides]|nr:hypothetical protein NQZ68_021106 [Dissostichus eleginoides]
MPSADVGRPPSLGRAVTSAGVNEVPDKPAAAAALETIAHDPDTVGCSHRRVLTLGQIYNFHVRIFFLVTPKGKDALLFHPSAGTRRNKQGGPTTL